MTPRRSPGRAPDWQQVLLLGEQLIRQPGVAGQKDTIALLFDRLCACDSNVWFIEASYPLPGVEAFGIKGAHLPPCCQLALETAEPQWNASEDGKARCALPLAAQGSLLALVMLERPTGQEFSEEEISLIKTAAAHITTMLQLRLQMTVDMRRFDQLALVRSVSFQIANVLDLDELGRRITSLILNTFHYYYVAILTLDPGQDTLTIRASAKAGDGDERPQAISVRLGEGIVGTVAQTGVERVASDVCSDEHYRYVDALPETRAEVAIPLKIENRVLGVLDIQSDQPDSLQDVDVMVLRALADNIALAVESARLLSAARRRTGQIATVAEVSRAITVILDLDELLREVVEVIHKRFGFPYVHIFTVHPGRRKVFFQAGSGEHAQAMQAMEFSYDLDDSQGIIPAVARSGKSLLVNDIRQSPLFRPNPLAPLGTQAELTLPLVFGGDVLGILDIQTDRPNGFDPDDQSLFEALADNVAIALRNAILYRSERWRRRVAESLRDVAGLLSANAAPDQVMDSIITELERNLPCDVAAIWLVDENGSAPGETPNLKLASLHSSLLQDPQQVRELDPQTDGWLQKALLADRPLIRNSDDPIGPISSRLEFPADYSSIAAPLRTGDQTLGILALSHHTSGRYGSEAQAMTATFASYAAVAIENSRLYSSAQEQAWISTVLLQVSEATQSQNTVEELASSMVRLMPLLVGVQGTALFLWDEHQQAFELADAYGVHPAERIAHRLAPASVPAFSQMLETRAPVIITDPERELLLPSDLVVEMQLKTLIMLPLVTRSEVMGALLITYDNPGLLAVGQAGERQVVDKRLAIIQGIAQQTAIAVENIRLLEAKQEDAYVTAVMLQVAQAVVSMNDLDDILEAIVHIMPILVGIDSCIIYLWDAGLGAFRGAHVFCGPASLESAVLAQMYPPGDFPLLDAVSRSDAPSLLPLDDPTITPLEWQQLSVPGDDDQHFNLEDPSGLLMAFPLSVKGDIFGVLLAQEAGSNPDFREKRLEILTGIAQQAALAIQNDRLNKEMVGRERLEREFQLAREIQQTFLPSQLPSVEGWDMDVRWRTARQVGGDFYDMFELPGDRLGVVIADVSDKGMPAALYMTVTRTLIRASISDYESPARVLEHVNDLLLMNSQNGMFVTTFYGILNPRSGEMIFANAGHNLPLVAREGAPVETLLKGGTALGALENIHLDDHAITLAPGDCLVLYTDGVTESFSPEGENFGEERLKETLASSPPATASALLDRIDTALAEYREGNPPNDDITILALRRLA